MAERRDRRGGWKVWEPGGSLPQGSHQQIFLLWPSFLHLKPGLWPEFSP